MEHEVVPWRELRWYEKVRTRLMGRTKYVRLWSDEILGSGQDYYWR